MIEVSEDIHVDAAVDAVWAALTDPVAVVACVPGAELTQLDGEEFTARITVKFGPMQVGFAGSGRLHYDDVARSGDLTARGGDGRGTTRAQGQVTFGVSGAAEGSDIRVRGTVTLSGPLAGVVERGAGSVVARLSRSFAEALAEYCSASGG